MREGNVRPEPPRQVISRTGIPVEIMNNPQAKYLREAVSLGVGGMATVETIRRHDETSPLFRRRDELSQQSFEATLEIVRRTHPDASSRLADYVSDEEKQMWRVAEEAAAHEHPEILREMDELRDQIKSIVDQRYKFPADSHYAEGVHVGREGVLIYSRSRADRIIKELDEVRKYDPEAIELPDEQMQEQIDTLKEKLKTAAGVADIHQIEVVAESQGKGIAAALLDIARWDIEETQGLDFSVARVMFDNKDKEKMLALFERVGFQKFFVLGNTWDGIPSYYLVVRENPRRAVLGT